MKRSAKRRRQSSTPMRVVMLPLLLGLFLQANWCACGPVCLDGAIGATITEEQFEPAAETGPCCCSEAQPLGDLPVPADHEDDCCGQCGFPTLVQLPPSLSALALAPTAPLIFVVPRRIALDITATVADGRSNYTQQTHGPPAHLLFEVLRI